MKNSQKDSIKKVITLIVKFLILFSIGIIIWNIFFYVHLFLLISSIVFLVIIGIIGLIFEIYEAHNDDNKEVNKILHKWIESEKKNPMNSDKICPSCGQNLLVDSVKCSNCGQLLKNE